MKRFVLGNAERQTEQALHEKCNLSFYFLTTLLILRKKIIKLNFQEKFSLVFNFFFLISCKFYAIKKTCATLCEHLNGLKTNNFYKKKKIVFFKFISTIFLFDLRCIYIFKQCYRYLVIFLMNPQQNKKNIKSATFTTLLRSLNK